MRTNAAARRYARALFAIARDEDAVAAVRADLANLEQLFDAEPELRHALFRPLHPAAERRSVLRTVCERAGTSAVVRNFLQYLVDQRRLIGFEAVRDEFERLADESVGRTRADVTAAGPLTDDQRERLRRALTERTGREVELDVEIDPGLIAGAVAVVGGLVFDGSLRTQLAQLRASLTRGH